MDVWVSALLERGWRVEGHLEKVVNLVLSLVDL